LGAFRYIIESITSLHELQEKMVNKYLGANLHFRSRRSHCNLSWRTCLATRSTDFERSRFC